MTPSHRFSVPLGVFRVDFCSQGAIFRVLRERWFSEATREDMDMDEEVLNELCLEVLALVRGVGLDDEGLTANLTDEHMNQIAETVRYGYEVVGVQDAEDFVEAVERDWDEFASK
jgi:hypothetical protein